METTQSATEAEGSSTAKRALLSGPPPWAETVTATRSPATIEALTAAGVSSPESIRPKSGSITTEARNGLRSCR